MVDIRSYVAEGMFDNFDVEVSCSSPSDELYYIQLQPIHYCFMEYKDDTAISSGYLHCTYKVTHYACLALLEPAKTA